MHFFRRLFRRLRRRPRAVRREGPAPPVVAAARLGDAFAELKDLDFERSFRGDPMFGKAMEERIIWRELFDLEMQELHEHMSRRSGR